MESDLDTTLVVYMGGCCGDLVTALIDHTNVGLYVAFRTIRLSPQRQRLKKPHEFVDNHAKDNYLSDISRTYKSVPSHDIEYHACRKHSFVGIAVTDASTALWAAHRFRNVHRPAVWHSVMQACGIQHVEQYAQLLLDYGSMICNRTDHLIDVGAIRHGELLPQLELILGRDLDQAARNCYRNWLDMQSGLLLE